MWWRRCGGRRGPQGLKPEIRGASLMSPLTLRLGSGQEGRPAKTREGASPSSTRRERVPQQNSGRRQEKTASLGVDRDKPLATTLGIKGPPGGTEMQIPRQARDDRKGRAAKKREGTLRQNSGQASPSPTRREGLWASRTSPSQRLSGQAGQEGRPAKPDGRAQGPACGRQAAGGPLPTGKEKTREGTSPSPTQGPKISERTVRKHTWGAWAAR